jgi:hypothetical protein
MTRTSPFATYNESLDILEKQGVAIAPYWRTPKAQLAFGMTALLNYTIDTWATVCGKDTKLGTFADVLACGISPYDAVSINL